MSKSHNNTLDRQTILNCVHRHLQESDGELGVLLPIGKMIPRIASELRGNGKVQNVNSASVPVMPMPLVAAFVDGDISADEERSICNAVLIDNSVLAEIVAALRFANEVNELPPLSSSMTARLMGIPTLDMSSETGAKPVISASGQGNKSLRHSEVKQMKRQRRMPVGFAVFVSLAASILALFWFGYFGTKSQIVDQPSDSAFTGLATDTGSQHTTQPVPPNKKINDFAVEPKGTLEIIGDSSLPMPRIPESTGRNEVATEADSKKIASETRVDNSLESMEPSETTHLSSEISGIRWTKISGLLAQRSGGPDKPKTVVESAWESVEPGRREWDSNNDLKPLELRTLPLSRAEASLASGGRIVLAADTGLQMTRTKQNVPGRLDLQHGFVALVDVPKGTTIDLCLTGTTMGTLRWESKATIVLGMTAAGLQAQIDGGEISIDDKSKRSTAVIIGPGKVTELKERITRIPNWVARPIESVSLPKAILAQIASSDNLGNTLNLLLEQQSNDAVDDQRMALISTWRASLNNENLYRQANARRPFVRIAALQRIVQTPEWDPRYTAIWSDIDVAIGDARKILFLRNIVRLARQGGKPNMGQVSPLLTLLESSDIASRALSDFLLRNFYGGGPVYDPTWTDEANTRGIGLWRRFINAATTIR